VKFTIIAVGRVRDRALAAAVADYEARAARYWPLEVAEVREETRRGGRDAMEREGERILARAAGAVVVACDERGIALSSRDLSRWVQGLREAARDVALVIGGPDGLDASVRDAAARVLTLAPFTLPHELARLVLAEQLYRAGTIQRGEPYHRD
jgi:23S rRNA (pseudouridine1915-N3)-methyltransferase